MTIEIKSPLKYFATTVGKAKLTKVNKNNFDLTFDNIFWMGYESNGWQAAEFAIELDNAYGKCVTTGLGLGIIQTLLSLNPKVTEVIVYELQQDIIDMFKIFAEHSNFDISKITIICQNADDIVNVDCDCLFLDHFEPELQQEIIRKVKNIAEKNTAKFVWFWPAAQIYLEYIGRQNLKIHKDSFCEWVISLVIKSFPVELSDTSFDYIKQLKDVYIKESPAMGKVIDNLDSRNALLNIFKKR